MCQLITCAKCCTIFSFVGFIFLLIIGALLTKQPKYVKGATMGSSSAPSVYYAALIYLGFLAISITYWGLHEGAVWGFARFRSSNSRAGERTSTYNAVEMTNSIKH